ncbi:zinc finger white collar 2 protein wc-2 [Ophiostoma piceae UAMH 11346]|uniref:Zinc finger white collar 2 protein wc-2 n=1 Tax=Ophiostoma piceae (strain UAMH 11346) TaxID=1262450 RepID=S3C9Q8_OPHP1|nr:zinc finger white collar 2 protein wc-2 [Ophiostoma piceae UAMH 11346]
MSNPPFSNEFFGYPGHSGSQNQTMLDNDQAMAAAVAAAGGRQVPLQMSGQVPGQMSRQMQQMPHMSQMQQMSQMAQMSQMSRMPQMAQMQQIPISGQVPVPHTAQNPDSDIMAYLSNPSFFESFGDMPDMLETNPTESSGAANNNLDPAAPAPGSMFPPSIPPSFSATPTNPGSNMTADNSPDKDSDMLDVSAGDSGPGGANEPGGGPQPVDEFIQTAGSSAMAAAGSAAAAANNPTASLTEFTRRKNWPAKLVEEMRDVLLIIDSNQRIKFASPSVTPILGYSTKGAVGLSLDRLVHRDDRAVFLADLNSSIANGTQLRLYLRIRKGNYKPTKLNRQNSNGVYEEDGSENNEDDVNGILSDGGMNGGTNGEANDEEMDGSESPVGTESYCIVEVVGHAHVASSRYATNPSNLSPFCQAVFLVARPYPTKNASLLDSFLEHKMENERLRRRIDDLRREEESEDRDDDESHTQSQSQGFTQTQSQGHSQMWRQSLDGRSDLGTSDNGIPGTVSGATGGPAVMFRAGMGVPSSISMPPPPIGNLNMGAAGISGALPAGLPPGMAGMSSEEISNMLAQNPALTRENLEGISAHKPDSLLDKMMRYNDGKTDVTDGSAPVAGSTASPANGKRAGAGAGGPSAANTISLLTGLYYAEGERSKGLSTGNRSPRLIKGDAGIAISANRADRSSMAGGTGVTVASDKKKKLRVADEYVCNDCGTLDSPEWRKGPGGPKTLCNACGLRWAKKEKKEKKKAAAMTMPGSLPNAPLGAMGNAGAGPVSNNGPTGMV